MPLPTSTTDRERGKFVETSGGEVAVRVVEDPTGTTANDPIVITSTGTGAINLTTSLTNAARLDNITLHMSAVPTTSEDLIIKIASADGTQYDTVLQQVDLAANSAQDIVYIPDGSGLQFKNGDQIRVTYPNTDGNTFGLRVTVKLV